MKLTKDLFRKNKVISGLSFLGMALLAIPLVFAVDSQANLTPKVPISDFQIDKTEAKPGETIKGSFTVKNIETFTVNDINLQVGISKKLESKETNENGVVINRSLGLGSSFLVESLTLKGGASLKKDFSYELPANMLDGEHILSLISFSGRGEIFGIAEEKNIKISGGGNFISITDEKIIGPNGKEYDPGDGIVFDSKSAPKIKFKAKNYSNNKISAKPQILVYKRYPDKRNLIKEAAEEKITLEANEEKDIEMTLPAFEKPTIYLADIILLDSSGKSLSNHTSFRWAIKGLSPQILKLSTDKAKYKKGEAAEVDYTIVGSGDTEERNENGALAIEIIDTKGRVVGNASEAVSLDGDGKKVGIKLSRSTNGYTLRAKILKGDEILDSYEVMVAGEETKSNLPIYLAGLLAVVILISGGAYMIKKNKSRLPKTIILFFLVTAVSFMFSGKAFAETRKYSQAPNSASYSWAAPVGHNFTQGDTMTISGTVSMNGCQNNFTSEEARVFLVIPNSYLNGAAVSFAGPLDTSQSGSMAALRHRTPTAYVTNGPNQGELTTFKDLGSAPITWGYGGVAGNHYYNLQWSIPRDLDPSYLNRNDTWIMVVYKGDHIDATTGAVVHRFRQVAIHQVTIATAPTYTLNVAGSGSGSVSGGPATCNIPAGCSESGIAWNSDRHLVATPASGYAFSSWSGNCSNIVGNTCNINDIQANKWVTVTFVPTYTLSYNGNGNTSGSPPASTTVNSGSNTTVAGNTGNLAKTNYIFAGWNTNSEGTGNNYSGGSTINITGDIVLYAKWELITLTCNLTAIPAGGTLPLTVLLNANPSTNAPSPSFTFDWNYGDGSAPVNGSTQNPVTHVYTTSGSKTPTVKVYLSSTALNCPDDVTFNVNPWSGGDQNEVAP